MIKVNELSKTFKKNKTPAVNNISFSVNSGEIVGVLGENGAGKTTTLRMIGTMLKPTSGNAIINGYDTKKEPEKVRSQVGILFGGETGLYDRLTARENINYFARLNNLSEEESNREINVLSKAFDMDNYIDKRVGAFSRGMKQKTGILRSVIHNPSVMLLDEPTTGLDISSSKIVQDFVIRCKKENKAILFSSHNIDEITTLCDRIIIINKGSIVATGSVTELTDRYKEKSLSSLFLNLTRMKE